MRGALAAMTIAVRLVRAARGRVRGNLGIALLQKFQGRFEPEKRDIVGGCPTLSRAHPSCTATMPQFFGIEIPKGEVRHHGRERTAHASASPPPRTPAPDLTILPKQFTPLRRQQTKKFAADEGDSIVLCQAALGLKPKSGERVTVFIQSGESPELAIGSLCVGTCDQFSLGTGLTFSSGETVSVRHNGSAAVCLTGRIEDDFNDFDLDSDDDDDDEDFQYLGDEAGDDSDDDDDDSDDASSESESDGEEDPKLKTKKLASAAAAAAPDDDDDDEDDDEEDSESEEEEEEKPKGKTLAKAKTPAAKKAPEPASESESEEDDDDDESESESESESDEPPAVPEKPFMSKSPKEVPGKKTTPFKGGADVGEASSDSEDDDDDESESEDDDAKDDDSESASDSESEDDANLLGDGDEDDDKSGKRKLGGGAGGGSASKQAKFMDQRGTPGKSPGGGRGGGRGTPGGGGRGGGGRGTPGGGGGRGGRGTPGSGGRGFSPGRGGGRGTPGRGGRGGRGTPGKRY